MLEPKLLSAMAAAILIPLAVGCSRNSSENQSDTANASSNIQQPVATSYGERLRAMADADLKAEFVRAARAANEACDRVASVTPPRGAGDAPVWTVNCADGGVLAMVPSATEVGRVLRTREAQPTAPPEPAPQPRRFGGTYQAVTVVFDMPRTIEFNGPRNCLVYTEHGLYDGLEEGTCVPAEGGMEFSMSTQFGGATKYFRSEGPDTLSYRRGGRSVMLRRQ